MNLDGGTKAGGTTIRPRVPESYSGNRPARTGAYFICAES